MTSPTTVLPCPFPDLQQFCEPDRHQPESLRTPFRAGNFWTGTDGKIMGWHVAEDGLVENNPIIRATPIIDDVEIHFNRFDWRIIPELAELAVNLKPCSDCKGSGKCPTEIMCESCDGAGECSHCGHECEGCDGRGKVENHDIHTHCQECGGTGKIAEKHRRVELDGHGIAWSYLSLLLRLGAQIAWNGSAGPSRRELFVFKVGDLHGIVMTLGKTSDDIGAAEDPKVSTMPALPALPAVKMVVA